MAGSLVNQYYYALLDSEIELLNKSGRQNLNRGCSSVICLSEAICPSVLIRYVLSIVYCNSAYNVMF